MNLFLVILVALFLYGVCTAQHHSNVDDDEMKSDFERVLSEDDLLEGSALASTITQEIDEGPLAMCSDVRFRTRLYVHRGTMLRNLTTRSIFECCEACERMEGCSTWRRTRYNDQCDLFQAEEVTFDRDYFDLYYDFGETDIGGFVGQIHAKVTSSPETAISEDIQSDTVLPSEVAVEFPRIDFKMEAIREASTPPCRITSGTIYPNGNVLAQGTTNSSYICCEFCRSSTYCNSWYFIVRNERCILNENTPQARVRNSLRFAGGTVFS
eukprot:g4234.t1